MSWVTPLWSMAGALCFALGGIYFLVWCKQRGRWAYLLFSCSAMAAGLIAGFELATMHATTTAQYGTLVRWAHVPLWVLIVSLVWFVHLYLRAGRRWLAWTICGLRTLALLLNFLFTPNLNYRQITGLRHLSWWGGETVSAPVGIPNPWTLVGMLSVLLLLVFFVDATITVWRRGDRRPALVVGGGAIFFTTLALGTAVLVIFGLIESPFFISFPYLGMIAAMGYDLSYDLLNAAQLAKQFQANEAALRESEARMSLAAEAANLILWVWDILRNEVWMPEKGRQSFGLTKSGPLDLTQFLKTLHVEDRERAQQAVAHALTEGGECECEFRVVRSDGETRWISGHGRVELDRRGKPIVMRGVFRDITHRKHAEDALRESEARFRAMADTAPVMIWMAGQDKLCTFFNKGWLDFTGRSLEQELGNGWAEGVHPEDIDRCLEVYGNSFDARKPFTMEYHLRRSDGKYRWILDIGTPRFAPDGEFLGYIGSCTDITARKEAELEQQRQHLELARVGRFAVIGELAASLAHEINNPIGAIVANASAGLRLLAADKIGTKEWKELLGDIVADGRRASDIIQGIRNMVRKGKARRELIQIADITHELVRIVHADAVGREVKVTADVNSDTGQVWGDPVQLLQVLLNLTINAFEAMTALPADERQLVIRAGRAGDGDIFVTVRDSGPGFPDGMVEQLFEPFCSTKDEGTGMGLAIARSIIEAHGGTLVGENCDDGGARFTVRLPQANADSKAA
jgi:two-component system sensor kinase FixL